MRKILSFTVVAAALAAAILPVQTRADDDAPPHEHSWVLVSHTDYTCTEDGYDLYICSGCGEEERRTTDPASHRNELVSETDATCESRGEMKYVCTVCGEETVISTPELGHDWGEGETAREPTLFTAGSIKYVCKRDPLHVKYEAVPSEFSSSPDARTATFSLGGCVILALIFAIIKRRRT